MPKPVKANFILNVETDELFINAGLQDRVIQVRSPTTLISHCSGQKAASPAVSVCVEVNDTRCDMTPVKCMGAQYTVRLKL